MIAIEKLSPKAHQIIVMGAFHHADAKQLVEFIHEQEADQNYGNALIDLTALADFSLAAVSEELVHLPALLRYVLGLDRIAIISDENWLRTMARLESALLPGVVYQVYDEDEAEAARSWVLEESDTPHCDAFREIKVDVPGIAAFELRGRIDRAEAERGVALVQSRLSQPECSRLMLVITGWHGFDAEVMLSDRVLPAKLKMIEHLDRYAIVGGPGWISGAAGIVGTLIRPEIRTFDEGDSKSALAWLRG